MNDLKETNEKIENSIRTIARKLLKDKEVDVIIGYGKGTTPLNVAPIFIRKEEDVDNLIWNNFCYMNLAKYLIPTITDTIDGKEVDLKVGIVSKGCVGRTLIVLSQEKKINLENIKIIGISCNGITNRQSIERKIGEREISEVIFAGNNIIVKGKDFEEKFLFENYLSQVCKACKVKAPPNSPLLKDIIVGESIELNVIEEDGFEDLSEFEAKSPEEKWDEIKSSLEECERCYACREACPFCYCNLCFVDQNKPIWFGKTEEYKDIFVYHFIRAFHMAGRCVACGACTGACPIGINLNSIVRKLQKIVKNQFNYTSGIISEQLPPMMTFSMEDKEDFMLEED